MPIGQAIEMDSRSGTPPVNPNYGLRDSDGDVQGMLALQQEGFTGPPPRRRSKDAALSPSSNYSMEDSREYVPARSNWNQNGNNMSNQTLPTNSSNSRGLSPIQDSPVELPAQASTVGAPNGTGSATGYYEDVDPRFAEPIPPNPPPPQNQLPASLMPGGYANNTSTPHLAPPLDPLTASNPSLGGSYESLPDGSRSPAASEASHFTSVSQRGVNPNWRPPPPGMGGPPLPGQYAPYGRRPVRQEDVILEANAANPDFAIPGAGVGRGNRGGRGARGAGGARAPGLIPAMAGNGGRYPGAGAI
jgi:hypothetical protein